MARRKKNNMLIIRKKLPDIEIYGKKIESYSYPYQASPKWNYYNVTLGISKKYLRSDATNCQGRIMFKHSKNKEMPRFPLSRTNNDSSITLEKGNPQSHLPYH